jgi:hypothetical protein
MLWCTCRITQHSQQNKMKSSNMGVVFGPTLLKNKGESVHGIMSVKYQNLVGACCSDREGDRDRDRDRDREERRSFPL